MRWSWHAAINISIRSLATAKIPTHLESSGISCHGKCPAVASAGSVGGILVRDVTLFSSSFLKVLIQLVRG